ncbi:hypothetical protein EXS62_00475 [Candidatus Kaiserbacteria bacterium]|nr:hypothetical protein [Candidatus Kaiserbacteria bacterium]
MHTRLVSWSRYALLAGMVLALVLIVPAAWFPFQLLKIAAFAACLAAAVLLFIFGGGARALLRTHGFYAALAVLAIPAAYGLSAFFSADNSIALAGYSIETDTILFALLASLAYLMSFTLFRTLRTARLLTTVVFWSLAAAAIFQLVSVTFGSYAIPLEAFTDRSVNLIGKWNDLGLTAALLALLLLVRLELGALPKLWTVVSSVALVFLIALLALVNFSLSWALLLAGCIIVGLLSLLRQRQEQSAETPRARVQLPRYALAGAALTIAALLYGGVVNTSLTKIFPVSSLEVRPGLAATMGIIDHARAGSVQKITIGTGPSTFGPAWLKYKPAEVNRTPFWNLDFNVGYSALATAFGSVGLVGALAWLVPLFLMLGAVVRAARLSLLSREERTVATLLVLGSLFLIATLVLYVPSQNIILLGCVLSGSAFGFLWRQGRSAEPEPEPGMWQGISVLVIAGGFTVLALFACVVTERRFVSQAYTGAGVYELAAGHVDAALAYAASAAKVEAAPDALRLAADAGLQKITAIAADTALPRTQAQQAFTEQAQAAVRAAQRSIAAAPQDYRGFFSLARIYAYLASLKVDLAYAGAQQAYTAAAALNPTSPAIPLAVARLEAAQGNSKNMEAAVTKALQLKPDYTDAILFVVQVNVNSNDLASAIRNTTLAVQTAPGVPAIWFELGLLYYAGGDTASAIPPLEQAIRLVSNYANAKYYLGLSYYAQHRTKEAKALFLDLLSTNPDNVEIKAIVKNIEAGKKPLEGLEPATLPQDRKTAPVTE